MCSVVRPVSGRVSRRGGGGDWWPSAVRPAAIASVSHPPARHRRTDRGLPADRLSRPSDHRSAQHGAAAGRGSLHAAGHTPTDRVDAARAEVEQRQHAAGGHQVGISAGAAVVATSSAQQGKYDQLGF